MRRDLRYCRPEKPDVSVRERRQFVSATAVKTPFGGAQMRTRGVAVLVLAVLLAAACGNATQKSSNKNTPGSTGAPTVNTADLKVHNPITETGVTDKDIRVGVVAAEHNPLGVNYGTIADGINAYFAMINSQGGIYGRTLKVAKVRDDNLGQNLQQVQAMVS